MPGHEIYYTQRGYIIAKSPFEDNCFKDDFAKQFPIDCKPVLDERRDTLMVVISIFVIGAIVIVVAIAMGVREHYKQKREGEEQPKPIGWIGMDNV